MLAHWNNHFLCQIFITDAIFLKFVLNMLPITSFFFFSTSFNQMSVGYFPPFHPVNQQNPFPISILANHPRTTKHHKWFAFGLEATSIKAFSQKETTSLWQNPKLLDYNTTFKFSLAFIKINKQTNKQIYEFPEIHVLKPVFASRGLTSNFKRN